LRVDEFVVAATQGTKFAIGRADDVVQHAGKYYNCLIEMRENNDFARKNVKNGILAPFLGMTSE